MVTDISLEWGVRYARGNGDATTTIAGFMTLQSAQAYRDRHAPGGEIVGRVILTGGWEPEDA